jgi:cell shape-determining protein MreC
VVTIPEHLRASMPDPLQSFSKNKNEKKKEETSKDHAATAKQLQQDLDRLNTERQARLQALLSKKKSSTAAPPPPAPMMFDSKRPKT